MKYESPGAIMRIDKSKAEALGDFYVPRERELLNIKAQNAKSKTQHAKRKHNSRKEEVYGHGQSAGPVYERPSGSDVLSGDPGDARGAGGL